MCPKQRMWPSASPFFVGGQLGAIRGEWPLWSSTCSRSARPCEFVRFVDGEVCVRWWWWWWGARGHGVLQLCCCHSLALHAWSTFGDTFGNVNVRVLVVITPSLVSASGTPGCYFVSCFTRQQLWTHDATTDPDLRLHLHQSMIDFWLAQRGSAFFGNFYSTMSVELVHRFRAKNLVGEYYNPEL
jgi:hypothetical protein